MGKKTKSHQKKWTTSEDRSDGYSSCYSTNTSWWKKDTIKEERIFIMGATADASDSDTSLDPTTAKRLMKKNKQLLKSNKAY